MKLIEAIVQNARCAIDPQFADARQDRILLALPHGSGFDAGTKILSVTDQKIVLQADFHHMDDHGFYCGWTEHKVTIRAHLVHGFSVHVSGQNKRQIKEYIADVLNSCLSADFDWIKK